MKCGTLIGLCSLDHGLIKLGKLHPIFIELNQPCELWEIDTRHDHVRQIDLIQIGDTDRVKNHICTIHVRLDTVRQSGLYKSSNIAM